MCYGVYRVLKNGKLHYVLRSCTDNEALAKSIADSFSRGEIVMPDGSTRYVDPKPHVVRPIKDVLASRA